MLNYYRNIPHAALSSGPGRFKTIEAPTLLLWGEDDSALGKELTLGTERFVNDLRLEYIPDCSHWVQQDRPEIVNAHMRSFLIDDASPNSEN